MIPTKEQLFILQNSIDEAHSCAGFAPIYPKADDFRDIVVILGSSRCGSSLLFHLLANTGRFWCASGEDTPLFKLHGFGWISEPRHSDVLSSILSEDQKQNLRNSLFLELGGEDLPGGDLSPALIAQRARRILWQWPHESFSIPSLVELVRRKTDWFSLLTRLGLEEGFYDLPGSRIDRRRALSLPDWILEDPPLVVPREAVTPSPSELGSRPLLLKTTNYAYRLPLLKALFPRSRFHFILMMRNPAAGINGLIDGWLSNAFHSHNMAGVRELQIEGYSSTVLQGHQWWKFDLPPGWSEFCDSPLAQVCAFQWRSAYESILNQLEREPSPQLPIRYEDLISSTHGEATLAKIFAFCQVATEPVPRPHLANPVMASAKPGPARWRQREEEIMPLLSDPRVKQVAERLGYDLNSPEGLI